MENMQKLKLFKYAKGQEIWYAEQRNLNVESVITGQY
jgi:hypothetical protein